MVMGLDLVRANVLRDATDLAVHDVGVSNGVEQRRLAVVHMAKDSDDGSTRLEILGVV